MTRNDLETLKRWWGRNIKVRKGIGYVDFGPWDDVYWVEKYKTPHALVKHAKELNAAEKRDMLKVKANIKKHGDQYLVDRIVGVK